MTAVEAHAILQRPRFGHPVCIDAKHVLGMAEELVSARMWANRRGLEDPFVPAPVEYLEHDLIGVEMKYWRECGFKEEAWIQH